SEHWPVEKSAKPGKAGKPAKNKK
ncbi:MAG: hypothetical protein RLZZ15_877, partial [Verrucomicrobiota bacterium]